MGSWQLRGDPEITPVVTGGVTYGLDNTLRNFEDMGFESWALRYASLADDAFSYTIRTRNAKGLGAIVPRDGQLLRVYYNGTRRFQGHVIRPMLGLDSLRIQVVGPWWWMGKISLSGSMADAGGTKDDRTSYVFPTQDLRKSFQALIKRAVTMGVPMASLADVDLSTRISGMYPFLKTTLSNMSFASALAELMSYVPDAVAWWDYDGTPALNITRRGDMVPKSYEVGASGSVRVESADIYPRTDQEVARVELKHMTRSGVRGTPRWASQGYGTAATPTQKRQVQIVTISGPETLEVLQPDDVDYVELKTKAATFKEGEFFQYDRVLADAASEYGKFLGKIDSPKEFSGWYLVTSGRPADWMRPDYGLKYKTLKVQGWFTGTYVGADGLGGCAGRLNAAGRLNWTVGGSGSGGLNTFKIYAEFEVEAINLAYPSTTAVYKKWDYDFLSPPAGLAQDLRNAQNWVPWEGVVSVVDAAADGANLVRKKINLTGSHPDHASMNAMVRAATYDSRKRITLELGSPARLDLGGLVNRMRRSPQDNIEWL